MWEESLRSDGKMSRNGDVRRGKQVNENEIK